MKGMEGQELLVECDKDRDRKGPEIGGVHGILPRVSRKLEDGDREEVGSSEFVL